MEGLRLFKEHPFIAHRLDLVLDRDGRVARVLHTHAVNQLAGVQRDRSGDDQNGCTHGFERGYSRTISSTFSIPSPDLSGFSMLGLAQLAMTSMVPRVSKDKIDLPNGLWCILPCCKKLFQECHFWFSCDS